MSDLLDPQLIAASRKRKPKPKAEAVFSDEDMAALHSLPPLAYMVVWPEANAWALVEVAVAGKRTIRGLGVEYQVRRRKFLFKSPGFNWWLKWHRKNRDREENALWLGDLTWVNNCDISWSYRDAHRSLENRGQYYRDVMLGEMGKLLDTIREMSSKVEHLQGVLPHLRNPIPTHILCRLPMKRMKRTP